MEDGPSIQEKQTTDADLHTHLLVDHHHHDRKGGMITMPFIIVNEAFEKLASYGLSPNMILYLLNVYHMDAVTGTSVLHIWSAFCNGLAVFGAFVSDSYLGPFRVIAIGSFSTLFGMTLLWLTSTIPQLTPEFGSPTSTQLAVLYLAFGLMAIGSGCIRPCCITFGVDQLKQDPTANNERLIDSYFNWYYASVATSSFFGFTVVVYIQDRFGWQIGFAVPVCIMISSVLAFLIGSNLYIKVKVKESPFSGLIRVVVLAIKNRKIRLLPDDCYNHSKTIDRVELTDNLTFLNKACVVRHSNPNPNPSTVEKVEAVKSLIRVIPIWSTGILLFTNVSQSYPTLQAQTMNRHVTSWFEIPAASYSVFMVLTLTIWVVIYDRLLVPFLAKYTHDPRGLTPKARMGVGLLISIIAMGVAAIVEAVRRDWAGSDTIVEMSAMWLVPQYVLLGLAEAFNVIGLMEYCYSELPKNMSSLAMAVFTMSTAVAGLVVSLTVNVVDSITSQGGNVSWLSSDINAGHLDYYYWLLSFMNLINFVYFLVCCRVQRKTRLSTIDSVGQ